MAGYCAAESPGPHGRDASGQRPRPILWAMPALFLVIALALLALSLPPALVHLPDAFLTLVRLTVSLCAALIAYAAWPKSAAWSLAFAGLGLLYNPVLTIHMTHDAWAVAHMGALVFFALHWLVMGSKLAREV